MTRKQVSTAVVNRLDALVNSEPECSRTVDALFGIISRLERTDRELFTALNEAALDAMPAMMRAAWLDGWQCGRDPDRLVFTDGTLRHPDPGVEL